MIDNFKQKKAHVAILLSVKTDFQMKSIARGKDKDRFNDKS